MPTPISIDSQFEGTKFGANANKYCIVIGKERRTQREFPCQYGIKVEHSLQGR